MESQTWETGIAKWVRVCWSRCDGMFSRIREGEGSNGVGLVVVV